MTKGSKGKQEKQVVCNVSVDGEWARGDAPAGTVRTLVWLARVDQGSGK